MANGNIIISILKECKKLVRNVSQSQNYAYQSNPLSTQTQDLTIAFGHGETVLLVERNKTLLKLGKAILEQLNYQVLTAQDGLELEERNDIAQYQFDLLILDAAMPLKEIEEITRQVCGHQPLAKTLFSTVYDSWLETGCCEKIGSEMIISKPFTIRSFSQAIHQTLH